MREAIAEMMDVANASRMFIEHGFMSRNVLFHVLFFSVRNPNKIDTTVVNCHLLPALDMSASPL